MKLYSWEFVVFMNLKSNVYFKTICKFPNNMIQTACRKSGVSGLRSLRSKIALSFHFFCSFFYGTKGSCRQAFTKNKNQKIWSKYQEILRPNY